MCALQAGNWQIQSVLLNEKTVLNNEGFLRLEITPTELLIQPIGFRFQIQQTTSRSAILESRGQVYFVDYVYEGNTVELKLTRPELSERIQIEAELIETDVESFA